MGTVRTMALTKAILFLLCAPVFGVSTAAAQSCVPGPRCVAAGQKSEAYTQQQQSRLRGPFAAADAGAASFCVMMVGAEVSRVCAEEQSAMGRTACASQAYQQSEMLKGAAEQARMSSQSMSSWSGDWKAGCGW